MPLVWLDSLVQRFILDGGELKRLDTPFAQQHEKMKQLCRECASLWKQLQWCIADYSLSSFINRFLSWKVCTLKQHHQRNSLLSFATTPPYREIDISSSLYKMLDQKELSISLQTVQYLNVWGNLSYGLAWLENVFQKIIFSFHWNTA